MGKEADRTSWVEDIIFNARQVVCQFYEEGMVNPQTIAFLKKDLLAYDRARGREEGDENR